MIRHIFDAVHDLKDLIYCAKRRYSCLDCIQNLLGSGVFLTVIISFMSE